MRKILLGALVAASIACGAGAAGAYEFKSVPIAPSWIKDCGCHDESMDGDVAHVYGYTLDLWDEVPTFADFSCETDACLEKAADKMTALIRLQDLMVAKIAAMKLLPPKEAAAN